VSVRGRDREVNQSQISTPESASLDIWLERVSRFTLCGDRQETLGMARHRPSNWINPLIRNNRRVMDTPQFSHSVFSSICLVKSAPWPGRQCSSSLKVAGSKPIQFLA
jgi:hypothetical protein